MQKGRRRLSFLGGRKPLKRKLICWFAGSHLIDSDHHSPFVDQFLPPKRRWLYICRHFPMLPISTTLEQVADRWILIDETQESSLSVLDLHTGSLLADPILQVEEEQKMMMASSHPIEKQLLNKRRCLHYSSE